MGFLGIRDKSDSGLKPIVQRAPASTGPSSAVSAHLVQPKAVVRPPASVSLQAGLPMQQLVAPPPPAASSVPPVVHPAAPQAVASGRRPQGIPVPSQPASVSLRARPQVKQVPSVALPARLPVQPLVRRGEDLAHLRKGVVLQARGEHQAAIEAFTKAIAADASCVEAYASRGISREALGDVDGARADYAKSIEVEVKEEIARHLGR